MNPPGPGIFDHRDTLASLNNGLELNRKLAAIHEALAAQLDFIDRIAVASYDAATDLLKTFMAAGDGRNPLVRYESRLGDSPSLKEILRVGHPRVVNDLELFRRGPHLHTQVIAEEGFRSSYTIPMYLNGAFWGFVFFNSRTVSPFTEESLRILDVYGHLIASIVTSEMYAVRILAAAVRTAHDMVHYRDPETGGHIDRMARYSRLIAQHLAATGSARLDDATIERIFEFAPLHDIGKISIPDRILLKRGALTPEERVEMQQHTTRGLAMIESIAHNFGLEHIDGIDLLRHIAEFHHEAIDGSGYPQGLHGQNIPIEARIVAVADIFDALTSRRPYKAAWSNAEAFAFLRKVSKTKVDEDCVQALITNEGKVKEIQERFRDEEAEEAGKHATQAAPEDRKPG